MDRLKCFYSNVDCLTQIKKVELEYIIENSSPKIIGLTEIYPKNCVYDLDESAYHIENYDMFLSPIGKGRGVILYTKKKLLAKLVTLDTDFNESIWCKIHLDKTDQMLLGCIYRSPNSTTANSEQLTTLINKLHKEKYSHLLVVGDFNYREINWIDNSTTVSENHPATKFLECIRDAYLYQHLKEPTRVRENNEPSTLDLVLTNEESMVENINFDLGLGKSYHLTLSFEYTCFTSTDPDVTFLKRNYFKGDYVAINENLKNIHWENALNGLDLAQSWTYFAEKLVELTESFIPVSKVRDEGKKNNPYVTRSGREAIKKKTHKMAKIQALQNSSKL